MTSSQYESEFLFEHLTYDHLTELLEFMSIGFGKPFADKIDWAEWFHRQCPTGNAYTLVAREKAGGRIVSSCTLLPINVVYNRQIVPGRLGVNGATHPGWRRRGLFVEMGKRILATAEEEGSFITVAVPNPKAVPGIRKVGKEVCELPFYERRNPSSPSPGVGTAPVDRFDKSIDRILERYASKLNFMIAKDHRFVNWRYARPDQTYLKFVHRAPEGVDGYLVMKFFKTADFTKAHIVDVMADNDEALVQLVTTAQWHARGLPLLNLWLIDGGIYRDTLEAMGFEKDLRNWSYSLNLHYHVDLGPLQAGARWFCLGDNDVY
jgi:hypothetical protein